MAIPQVLELAPQLKARIWGGRRLAKTYAASSNEPLGEAWVVFDGNEVVGGRYAGRIFKEVMPDLGEEFLGREFIEKYGYEYPLMIKFIDAAEWLSVQVHPNDEYAAEFEEESGYSGKEEAWLILDAAPDARIVYGLAREASAEEVRRAALDGSLSKMLNYVKVSKGDFIYLPAGTIHALGPGILAAEVSQRSDLTYRLFDYGRGRELHIEKALEVADLTLVNPEVQRAETEFRFLGRKFEIGLGTDKLHVKTDPTALVPVDEMGNGIVIAIGGIYEAAGVTYFYCQPR